jgi:antirestriction protein ArdC
MSKTTDTLTAFTASVVAALEEGIAAGGTWTAPWHKGATIPTNATTGKAYTGGNVLYLWAAQQAAGHPTALWATYKQWAEKGAQVRKGEKSSTILRLIPYEMKGEGDEEARRTGVTFRAYAVFNAAQVDGYEAPEAIKPLPDDERDAAAEAFFAAIGATVLIGGDRAAYSPFHDHIMMPPFAAFHSGTGYYGTLAHEHIHWTGHADRLNRIRLTAAFGSDEYAREELVAEIGASLVAASLGLEVTPRVDHSQYLAHWASVLRNEPRALWTAASAAQKAADWLHGAAGRTVAEEASEEPVAV